MLRLVLPSYTQFGLDCVRRERPLSRRTNLSESASHVASIQVCHQVFEDGFRTQGVARAVSEKAHTTQRSNQRISVSG